MAWTQGRTVCRHLLIVTISGLSGKKVSKSTQPGHACRTRQERSSELNKFQDLNSHLVPPKKDRMFLSWLHL